MQETQVQSLSWEDSPGEGNGNPLQYSCLENSMDRGSQEAAAHGIPKSGTRLSDFTFTFSPPEPHIFYFFRMPPLYAYYHWSFQQFQDIGIFSQVLQKRTLKLAEDK